MEFPLPLGHVFGVNPYSIMVHDGADSFIESQALRAWQHRVMITRDPDLTPTGRFDGPTQQACIKIQRELGIPVSALLDRDTWDHVWKAPETALDAPEGPVDAPVDNDTPETPGAPEAPRRGRPRRVAVDGGGAVS